MTDAPAPLDDLGRAENDAAFVLSLRERGVRDTAILRALERVPRALFARSAPRAFARRDIGLPIACGATMTAPTTIAAMLLALEVTPGARVLEIGTGSGYATALLAQLGAAHIVSLERYATLAEDAADILREWPVVEVRHADGLGPLPEDLAVPGGFDRILANGSVAAIPEGWTHALAPGGRIVAPLSGASGGRLVVIERGQGERGEGGFRETLGAPLRLPALVPGRAAVL